MRKIGLVLGILGTLAATAAIVWAGRGGGVVDSQSYAWIEEPATTASSEWAPISGLGVKTGCQDNVRSSAALSLDIAEGSSPVQVRVAVSDPLCVGCDASYLHPAEVTLTPGSSSFTFVGRAEGSHGTAFTPQWRVDPTAPPNSTATADAGSLHVLWNKLEGACA